ncbi:MAG: class I SAM-dependent methyltransferase [Candidatus Atabeyarchaeum deiterrae]
MGALEWKVSKYLVLKGSRIPVGEEVPMNPILQYSPLMRRVMSFAKPLAYLRDYFFVSGFIHGIIGGWIRENVNKGTTFLDIGCGDLRLKKQLPRQLTYNAFDISFSEYTLDLALRSKSTNIAIASATKIPLDSNQVDVLTATEVLEHIPQVDKALDEIRRVARPKALFLVSIPNNYCYKYHVKGQNPDHRNKWTFDEFITHLESRGFKLIKSCKKGWWIPLPVYLAGKTSYQLPITSDYEYYDTNFFYMFKVLK